MTPRARSNKFRQPSIKSLLHRQLQSIMDSVSHPPMPAILGHFRTSCSSHIQPSSFNPPEQHLHHILTTDSTDAIMQPPYPTQKPVSLEDLASEPASTSPTTTNSPDHHHQPATLRDRTSKSATVRSVLQRLHLANEAALIATTLSHPTFLAAWAEFRDDFLWDPSSSTGLSAHVFLKTVGPLVVAELAYATTPYLPADGSPPDKGRYVENDHYVRFILQVLPALRQPGRALQGRCATDAGLRQCVEDVGFLVHLLRGQYRPGGAGTLARWRAGCSGGRRQRGTWRGRRRSTIRSTGSWRGRGRRRRRSSRCGWGGGRATRGVGGLRLRVRIWPPLPLLLRESARRALGLLFLSPRWSGVRSRRRPCARSRSSRRSRRRTGTSTSTSKAPGSKMRRRSSSSSRTRPTAHIRHLDLPLHHRPPSRAP